MSVLVFTVTATCPECKSMLRIRTNHHDRSQFIGCGGYPRCQFTQPFDEVIQSLAGQILALKHREPPHPRSADVAQMRWLRKQICDEVRELVFKFHPDRNGSLDPNTVTAELNRLRDQVTV